MTLEETIKQYEQIINIWENHNLTESQEVIEQLTAELRELQEPKEAEECVREFGKKYLLVIKQLAVWLRELQRARVLLKATHDLLEAADDSPYVEDVLAMLVHYDDMDCDGYCLMEDIEYYFDEFGAERRTE